MKFFLRIDIKEGMAEKNVGIGFMASS